MSINKIKPYGLCLGVKNAVSRFKQILKLYKNKQIYLVNPIAHNQILMDSITKNHKVIIKDKKQSTIDFVRSIVDKESVIVFSAHGAEKQSLEFASKHFKYVYNLTCPYILKNINLMNKFIKQKYKIIFIGKKQHPETKNILSLNKSIILYDIQNAKNNKLNKLEKYLIINQTTLNNDLLNGIHNKLISKVNKKSIFTNTTCNQTLIRYKNISKLNKTDLLIIVGDVSSNNTNNLKFVAEQNNIKSFLISSVEDIRNINVNKFNKIYITSGTSTPNKLVEDVYKALQHRFNRI
jgi:4-hydroxy-3-methylbut-2-enyl diphosphate reductase